MACKTCASAWRDGAKVGQETHSSEQQLFQRSRQLKSGLASHPPYSMTPCTAFSYERGSLQAGLGAPRPGRPSAGGFLLHVLFALLRYTRRTGPRLTSWTPHALQAGARRGAGG